MSISEPKCIEVGTTASVGGKVQVVKFDVSVDYFYSISRKYSIPEDWTEEDVDKFQLSKTLELREKIEPFAQSEADDLLEQKAEIERKKERE